LGPINIGTPSGGVEAVFASRRRQLTTRYYPSPTGRRTGEFRLESVVEHQRISRQASGHWAVRARSKQKTECVSRN
jgi:hypothetical protein